MERHGKSLVIRQLVIVTLLASLLVTPLAHAQTQKVESKDRDRGQQMLSMIKNSMKKNYYDPAFRGMDLETRFATASQKIKDASSVGQIFGVIAQVLIELDDSHTFFIPPSRAYDIDYGWTA